MRILVDTNILLYAVNPDAPQHAKAKGWLQETLSGGRPWCLTWSTIYEFLAVATHARFSERPLTAEQAWRVVASLLGHPSAEILIETPRHRQLSEEVMGGMPSVRGTFFHDCHIAALMREHDVRAIATADAEFRKFGFLEVLDPTRS